MWGQPSSAVRRANSAGSVNRIHCLRQTESPSPSALHQRSTQLRLQQENLCLANAWGKITANGQPVPTSATRSGGERVEDRKVVCPWHAWIWEPKTGQAVDHPKKLKACPMKIENGEVFIEIQPRDHESVPSLAPQGLGGRKVGRAGWQKMRDCRRSLGRTRYPTATRLRCTIFGGIMDSSGCL